VATGVGGLSPPSLCYGEQHLRCTSDDGIGAYRGGELWRISMGCQVSLGHGVSVRW
jgi:hypothetical protein